MRKDVERIYHGITNIGEDLIEEAQAFSKNRKSFIWVKWAAAACVCLAAVGAFALFGGNDRPIRKWSENYQGEDYFAYNKQGERERDDQSIGDALPPYAFTRDFSDNREDYEKEGILPIMEAYPEFTCRGLYNEDGSLYGVEISWDQRGDHYSSLKITAGYQEVEEIACCLVVEVDEQGNVLEPAVTVTERDGVQIVAEGKEGQDLSLTFQNDQGWYQVEGSWNDDYESVASLLDWVWEHPLDFALFAPENGVEYLSESFTECPEELSDYMPDVEAFGYRMLEGYGILKDSVAVSFEGHYSRSTSSEVRDNLHWCIDAEPEYYQLEKSLGKLEDLTKEMVKEELKEESSITFLWEEVCITFYPESAEAAWNIIESIR